MDSIYQIAERDPGQIRYANGEGFREIVARDEMWEEFDLQEALYWDRFLREHGRDEYMAARYFVEEVNEDGEEDPRFDSARSVRVG